MKVSFLDIMWSVTSMIVLGISFRNGKLLYGLIAIYVMMAVVFFIHIFRIRKSTSESVAVYGTVIGYEKSATSKRGTFPVVTYITEDGREIRSVSCFEDKEELYEVGSEEMICYDPKNPVFFYFSNRENEMTDTYYRFIIFGGVIAAILFVIAQMR